MKVLFLNVDLGYGGAEKMMAWVANALSEAGNDVTFLTYRDANANYQKLLPTVRREHIQLESDGGSILGFAKCVTNLRRYIKKEQFDLAIAFLSPSQIRLVQACKGTNTKVLLSQRSDPYYKSKLKGLRKLLSSQMGKLFLQADAFVFQTPKAQQYYSQEIQKKSVVIPNPIRPLCRTIERNPEKRIVNVARLDLKQKRQDLIIAAFNKISPRYPEYILEFYGSGADENLLKELAKDNPNIIFKGVTTNVVESIQNAAMFVLASDFEGIPNALLEAMSLGLPCVSTDCSPGGAALLIDSPDCGSIVPRNDVDALAEAMRKYIENPEIAESHGVNAMSVNDRFSEEKIAKQWKSFVNSLSNEN